MYCEVHERPKTMDCEICGKPLCKQCAEFVEGGWLCPECVRQERQAVLQRFDPLHRETAAVGSASYAHTDE
ncbi:MAG: hypothetical protein PVJ42_00045 [bacterium]|jgi:hypothetical protein